MSKNEEYPRHWRCKVCGQSSPITAYKCNNPQCGADLLVSGEIIFEETAPPPPPPPPFDWEEVETETEKKKPKQKKPKKEKVKREKPKEEKVQREKKPKETKSGKGWLIGLAAVLAIALLAALALPRFGDSGSDTQLREPEIPTTTQTQPVDTAPVDTAPPVTNPPATDPPATEALATEPTATEAPSEPWENNLGDGIWRIREPKGTSNEEQVEYCSQQYFLSPQAPNTGADWNDEIAAILRKDIHSVTFLSTLQSAPDDAWDMSGPQDRSILAWAEPYGSLYDIYIAAEGGMRAGNCPLLFAGCRNMVSADFGDAFHTDYVDNMNGMFYGCEALEKLDLRTFQTGDVQEMNTMFCGCISLTEIDLSSFQTAEVENMYAMFNGCRSLESLDLSNFDTHNVDFMPYMFGGCTALKELDLSNFVTSKVYDMNFMFSLCISLTDLNISNFDTANVTSMRGMFYGINESCKIKLDPNAFDTSNVTDYDDFMIGDTLPDGKPWIELFE